MSVTLSSSHCTYCSSRNNVGFIVVSRVPRPRVERRRCNERGVYAATAAGAQCMQYRHPGMHRHSNDGDRGPNDNLCISSYCGVTDPGGNKKCTSTASSGVGVCDIAERKGERTKDGRSRWMQHVVERRVLFGSLCANAGLSVGWSFQ